MMNLEQYLLTKLAEECVEVAQRALKAQQFGMNLEQYLLTKLAEECVEVAQRALKAQQFGMNEIQPGQEKNNRERLHDEINDLLGVIDILNQNVGFRYTEDRKAIAAKGIKVEKYLHPSQSLGKVQ